MGLAQTGVVGNPLTRIHRLVSSASPATAACGQQAFALEDNPFDDPFLKLSTATPARLSQAVYASFTAYLWLLGLMRTASMTKLACAIWLENNCQLDAGAVWAITSMQFSVLGELHTALHMIMQQVTNGFSEIELQVKQKQYLQELQQASSRRYT